MLLTYQDLNLREEQFRESITGFSDFLGIFDEYEKENFEKFTKSIGIVVTRVENDFEYTEIEMKESVRDKLVQILNNTNSLTQFTTYEIDVFKKIVENGQIEIFSNPKKKVDLTNEEGERMRKNRK